MLKKKICAHFQRIVEIFTQKIFNILSDIWVWDPGSGKNLFRIPDPGVKKAPDPGSGSATLVKRKNLDSYKKRHKDESHPYDCSFFSTAIYRELVSIIHKPLVLSVYCTCSKPNQLLICICIGILHAKIYCCSFNVRL